jgi:hypothetical protein
MSAISNWPFQDPQNVAIFTTKHIAKNGRPILFVFHDADDGAWQFHSDDITRSEDMMILALSEIVEIDPTIAELADLPFGWKASRNSPLDSWKRQQHK